MIVLNLGCGYRTSDRCINIDWSVSMWLQSSRLGRRIARYILTGERRKHFEGMRGQMQAADLRRGIPYANASVDAVYHSHVLEHIDRESVPGFLAEVRRVLKAGGVHRIVVPDLEAQARAYLASLDRAIAGEEVPDHEATIHDMIEQMVRRESYGTSRRTPLRRRVENALLGDARRRGETHQWMWDRVSLPRVLEEAGFSDIEVTSFYESRLPDWPAYGLDVNPDGSEYKPGSLYIEAG